MAENLPAVPFRIFSQRFCEGLRQSEKDTPVFSFFGLPIGTSSTDTPVTRVQYICLFHLTSILHWCILIMQIEGHAQKAAKLARVGIRSRYAIHKTEIVLSNW